MKRDTKPDGANGDSADHGAEGERANGSGDLFLYGLNRSLLRDLVIKLRAKTARRAFQQQTGTLGLIDWAQRYLPHYFRLPPSAMHRWMAEQLEPTHVTRGAKINVIGPRGGAKSTVATLSFVLRAALEGWEPYIWIVSDTRQQACRHLASLRSELLGNRAVAVDYADAAGRGSVWRQSMIELRNGVVIEAFGTGQAIRGSRRRENRPTLIICDDLENDQHIASRLQRQQTRDWFDGALLKAGTTKTNVVSLATALHREALAMRLHTTPGWTSKIFRSIERWPELMTLWHQWESLYCDVDNPQRKQAAADFFAQNQAAMEQGAGVLWPEHEDLHALMCMRAEAGHTAFEREKQGSPVNAELFEWPEEYFDERIWFDDWPENLQVRTVALDPSKGHDASRGDYSAFVSLGVDARGVLFVEADLARRPTPQMVADGVELCRKFRPDAFAVEANQFQDLLGGEFEAEFMRQGLLEVRPWTLDNRVNKLVRIRRLGPYLSTRRLRFKNDSPSTRLLVEQLRQFPTADHDDGPDALEMAVRLAAELLGSEPADDGLGQRLPLSV